MASNEARPLHENGGAKTPFQTETTRTLTRCNISNLRVLDWIRDALRYGLQHNIWPHPKEWRASCRKSKTLTCYVQFCNFASLKPRNMPPVPKKPPKLIDHWGCSDCSVPGSVEDKLLLLQKLTGGLLSGEVPAPSLMHLQHELHLSIQPASSPVSIGETNLKKAIGNSI